jgi:hypothetical protein
MAALLARIFEDRHRQLRGVAALSRLATWAIVG